MKHSIRVSMIEGVNLLREADDQAVLETPVNLQFQRARITFRQVTPALWDALERVRCKGATIPFLIANAMQHEGMPGIAKVRHYLKVLAQQGILNYDLLVDEVPFASIQALTCHFIYEENRANRDQHYVMSKFAYCRNDKGKMTLNTPLSCARIQLHHPAALAALHRLTRPCLPGELAEAAPELDADSALAFMNILANGGAVQPSDGQDETPEDSNAVMGQWAFHDLLFHANSRLGRHGDPYGGTYPFKDKFDPLPVIKPRMSDEIVPLYKPDLAKQGAEGAPFSRVLEARQTIREYAETPMTVEQLGELLYRSARVKKIVEEAGVSWRPSPGGGAIHELEIYPVVNQCAGLPFGLYHYNPLEHYLSRVTSAPEELLRILLEMSGITGKLDQPPQVLLILAARFQRIQMKYQSVGYSVILKNVGCLYQTMYLVAADMGLAPCALGGGNSDLFAQVAGLDYYAETSVGEFLLGSAPPVRPEAFKRPKGVE